VTRPRPPVVRRAAVAAVAAVRAAVDRAARPPTRCASELVLRGAPPSAPVLSARSGR
jgi:hypothetical protein